MSNDKPHRFIGTYRVAADTPVTLKIEVGHAGIGGMAVILGDEKIQPVDGGSGNPSERNYTFTPGHDTLNEGVDLVAVVEILAVTHHTSVTWTIEGGPDVLQKVTRKNVRNPGDRASHVLIIDFVD